ncbi:MAG: OmpA family protein [Myxococcales bacterium]|nr:OmpA family protein [Myxococcales bacterium]
MASAVPVGAQEGGAVELERYRPITPVNRGFELEGTKPLGHLAFAAGLDMHSAFNPLRVTSLAGGASSATDAVRSAWTANLLLAVGLGTRFEVALALPFVLRQVGDAPPGAVAPAEGGLGDARFTGRARLLDSGRDGLSLSSSVTVTSGLGNAGVYLNEAGPTLEPRLVAAWKRRNLQIGGRLGVRFREETQLLGTRVGHQLSFAAGVDHRFGRAIHGVAEVVGATPAGGDAFSRRSSPVELLVGGRYQRGRFNVGLAGGPGLVSGFGSPAFRVLASATWTTSPPDADRDGLADTEDACPDDPEDRDGFEDVDGCPEPDNDHDGVLDPFDHCPLDAEDLDGFEDEDGCPDLDNDQDGVADAADKCPSDPETLNGFEDDDGCPDELPNVDTDGDGIFDRDDGCPQEPEDRDGFEDEDGCPDPDNDKDGINDAEDKCPSEPETINGRDDEDGCPDEGAPQVRIGDKELEVLQAVFFKTNRFRIRHRFWNILNQVALTLKAHPELGRCAVEGHADQTGPADWNKRLSVMRAEAVVDYLAQRGVDPKRLVAIGVGDKKPWADNDTEEGRARNRRVVFHIEGIYSTKPPSDSTKVRDRGRGVSLGSGGHGAPAAGEPAEERKPHRREGRRARERREDAKSNAPTEEANEDAPPVIPDPPKAPPPPPSVKAKTLREAVQLPALGTQP